MPRIAPQLPPPHGRSPPPCWRLEFLFKNPLSQSATRSLLSHLRHRIIARDALRADLDQLVPEGTPAHKRTARALVFAAAMKVQSAMPAGQRCVVHTSIMKDRAFVTIQLETNESPEATDAHEVARVVSMLEQVAAGR